MVMDAKGMCAAALTKSFENRRETFVMSAYVAILLLFHESTSILKYTPRHPPDGDDSIGTSTYLFE
jgi:hypothetical protein